MRRGRAARAALVSTVTIVVLSSIASVHASGLADGRRVSARRPAPGWIGERVVSRRYDDWEPAIAADPRAPKIYRLVTRYGHPACARHCPDAAIVLQVSGTDGRTWGASRYLCRCRGSKWQADPQIEVASDSGIVEAAFLNQYNVWFTRSSDHGKTWTTARSVMGSVRWGDKPQLATSASGKDVYIAFNGPTHGDAYVAVSHDFGSTWQRKRVITSTRYSYAFGGDVLADGTVAFSETTLRYAPHGRRLVGNDQVVVIRSIDGGTSWTTQLVATLQLGRVCRSKGCPADFYDGHSALAADGSGRLLLLADGAVRYGGVRRVFAWVSDDGTTWGPGVQLSRNDVGAGFPAAVGTSDGFRVWFTDRATGRWNVVYRTSNDGVHWGPRVRLSNATGAAPYQSRAGFDEVYGDYGEIDVTDTGATVAIWGEGPSYTGPGGCWFARQRSAAP